MNDDLFSEEKNSRNEVEISFYSFYHEKNFLSVVYFFLLVGNFMAFSNDFLCCLMKLQNVAFVSDFQSTQESKKFSLLKKMLSYQVTKEIHLKCC